MKTSSELNRYLDSAIAYKRSIYIEKYGMLEYLDMSLLEDIKLTADHYERIGE